MRTSFPRCLSIPTLLLAAACAPAPAGNSGGGTGGSTQDGTGGQQGGSGTGGTTVSGGSGGASFGNSRLGSGGPFTFPQNKKPGSCTLTTASGASASVQSAYNYWKSAFVTTNGANGNLRVQNPQNLNGTTNGTVSEGIGYGMLAAVYIGDRTTFDGLWAYAKDHFDDKGLMNWKITSGGTTASDGVGSASDGDEDMAWALLMASDQWSNAAYITDAKNVITAMWGYGLAADGMLRPGDGWGNADIHTFPDYFSPAYYRVFADVQNEPGWINLVVKRGYEILSAVGGTDGLVPDEAQNNSGTLAAVSGKANYGYDACRTPWRIGMDYCFNGESRAHDYLMKVGGFFNGIGASNIGDGYSSTGSQTSSNKNMAFIGPAGVAGMAGYQSLLDGAFMYGANGNGGDTSYFPQSLRVVTMLMMSGNFVDFSKP